ncbi:MAG TPA: helix-turn-helix domain-containing protein [Streptosporangiaceae bacterium]|nr:helix-turn-helix domain-containing protein [Streptosporangiaceae bacterium]
MSSNAEPGVEQPAAILDTAVMRAMAHPARLALLEHLRNGGPATATECAGVVGLSPSATSYHLRALARAGLVEAAPGRGDGRERLWRITAGRYAVTGVADLAPEGREALRALMESLLAWDEVRVRRYLSQLDAEPPEWQDAALFMDSTLQVTAEELTALSQAVSELLEPYRKDRRADLPPGTRPVSVAIRALPS